MNLGMGDHAEIFLCELLCGLYGALHQGCLSHSAVGLDWNISPPLLPVGPRHSLLI
jgi:hypothetical protein